MSKPVVVGVDGSKESKVALRWAAEYARAVDAPLQALISWRFPPSYGWAVDFSGEDFAAQAAQTLDEAVNETLGAEAAVERRVEQGPAALTLVEASKEAQLLVLGSRGHGQFTGMLLGSVSEYCVHHAHCPVTLMRCGKNGG